MGPHFSPHLLSTLAALNPAPGLGPQLLLPSRQALVALLAVPLVLWVGCVVAGTAAAEPLPPGISKKDFEHPLIGFDKWVAAVALEISSVGSWGCQSMGPTAQCIVLCHVIRLPCCCARCILTGYQQQLLQPSSNPTGLPLCLHAARHRAPAN